MSEVTTPKKTALMAGLTGLEKRTAGSGPDWLVRRRAAARARLDASGFPTTRDEAWRSTDTRPIVDTSFAPGPGDAPAGEALSRAAALDLGGTRITFVDGKYCAALSRHRDLPAGVLCGSLAWQLADGAGELESWLDRPEEDGAFANLNGAFAEDGALVVVPDGVRVPEPIQIVYVATASAEPTSAQIRSYFRAGRDSHAVVAEIFVSAGDGAHFTNVVTNAWVGDNGELHHYRIQDENDAAYHVASIDSRQGRDSRYLQHNFNLGGRLVRNDVRAVLDGEGANCLLNGLYVTRGRQHIDHHTILDHARPHGDSREVYKGVLADASRAVFSGRIIVREGAQKTDAKQSNPNILLSDRALAQTRPQLEIYADDVKCTHGATVGKLDADAIFYLRSRGVPEAEARNLMIRAFAAEVLERMDDDTLRPWLEAAVDERLPRGDR